MSINDKLQKIKLWAESPKGRGFYFILLIVLVGLSSFGLGRLSRTAVNNEPVRIEYEAQSLVANVSPKARRRDLPATSPTKSFWREGSASVGNSTNSLFVASKRGKKYYPVICPAGSSLKEDNKIFFQTEAQAEEAGYIRSTSC